MHNKKIGFIGQGFIGKNYSDDFEKRGYKVVRYSLDEEYIGNRELISQCDIVFIAVPTPTTPSGYDVSLVESTLELVGAGKTAVIKSTLLPGTTEKLQSIFPHLVILHSPEFLREKSAGHDASHPERNIIGVVEHGEASHVKAQEVLSILPLAPYSQICLAREAELIKYAGNNFLTMKVVYMNIMYEVAQHINCSWEVISKGLAADSRIGNSHMNPVHEGGRGAGGHCFIKDFAAFREYHENILPNENKSNAVLRSIEVKNISLLLDSKKNMDLLQSVYGEDILP